MDIQLIRKSIGKGKIRLSITYDPPLASTLDGHMVDEETLDFELYENPINDREKNYNAMLLKRAEKICKYREECFSNGILKPYRSVSELGFVDFYRQVVRNSDSKSNYTAGLKCFRQYTRDICPYSEANTELCLGYKEYLMALTRRIEAPLNQTTVRIYFNQFLTILGKAFVRGYIKEDLSKFKRIEYTEPESHRYYIQKEQINLLAKQQCSIPDIKRMCFFLLLTRFRIGEVKDLDWKNIVHIKGERPFILKKYPTGNIDKVYISDEACLYLGKPQSSGRVFRKMSYVYARTQLRNWVSKAGLPSDEITFESFRRGFDSIEDYL